MDIKINDVDKMLKIIKNEEKLFDKLAALEIDGLEKSHEYKKTIEYIEMCEEATKHIFDDLSYSTEQLLELDQYLLKLNDSFSIYLDILNDDGKNNIRRLQNEIFNFAKLNQCYLLEGIDFPFEDDENEFIDDEEIEEAFRETFDDEEKIEYLKCNIFAHCLMDYVLDEIEHIDDVNIKNELIKYKYKILMMDRQMIKRFINDKECFTTEYYYFKELYPFLNEDYDLEWSYIEPLREELNFVLLDILNNRKKDDKDYFKILFLRACLSINFSNNLDEEFKETVKTHFKKRKSKKNKEKIEKALKLNMFHCIPKIVDFD